MIGSRRSLHFSLDVNVLCSGQKNKVHLEKNKDVKCKNFFVTPSCLAFLLVVRKFGKAQADIGSFQSRFSYPEKDAKLMVEYPCLEQNE